MAYERCVACGSSRVTLPTTAAVGDRLQAYFELKNPPKGFLATSSLRVDIDKVCLCADCGFAAFFASQKFDPDAIMPG
jgi:predicted nucleic-acid-binding Zn-ribbon protein